VNEFNESYHKENNPYLTYLEDFTAEDFIDQPIKEVNDDCKAWCEDNDIDFKRNMFIQNTKRNIEHLIIRVRKELMEKTLRFLD